MKILYFLRISLHAKSPEAVDRPVPYKAKKYAGST